MKYICGFLLALAFVLSCSPVRTSRKTDMPKHDKDGAEVVENEHDKNISRFHDTTTIRLKDVSGSLQNDLNKVFEKAYNQFKNEQYNRACPKFRILSETLAKGDSLLYEAMFLDCECMIMEDKIIDAKVILEDILDDEATPDPIREKTLIRVGQVECVLKNIEKAEMYFSRFREEYPNSKYMELANCNAIQQ